MPSGSVMSGMLMRVLMSSWLSALGRPRRGLRGSSSELAGLAGR